jgi:hypothetical protein
LWWVPLNLRSIVQCLPVEARPLQPPVHPFIRSPPAAVGPVVGGTGIRVCPFVPASVGLHPPIQKCHGVTWRRHWMPVRLLYAAQLWCITKASTNHLWWPQVDGHGGGIVAINLASARMQGVLFFNNTAGLGLNTNGGGGGLGANFTNGVAPPHLLPFIKKHAGLVPRSGWPRDGLPRKLHREYLYSILDDFFSECLFRCPGEAAVGRWLYQGD